MMRVKKMSLMRWSALRREEIMMHGKKIILIKIKIVNYVSENIIYIESSENSHVLGDALLA